MGVTKGINNFSKHQQQVVEQRVKRIQTELAAISPGQIFTTLSGLVRYIAKNVGAHPTTLSRNIRYISLIQEKFLHQKGLEQYSNVQQLNEYQLAASLKSTEVELEIVKNDNARLRKQLSRLLSANAHENQDNSEISTIHTHAPNYPFEDTARSLALVLERLTDAGLGIELDSKQGEIVDLSKHIPSERTVVENKDLKHFIEWQSNLDALLK
jgi:hypothetical protein